MDKKDFDRLAIALKKSKPIQVKGESGYVAMRQYETWGIACENIADAFTANKDFNRALFFKACNYAGDLS